MPGSERSRASCACSAARSASRSNTAYLLRRCCTRLRHSAATEQSGSPVPPGRQSELLMELGPSRPLLAAVGWLLAEAALEPRDAAAGVQDLLLAGVERVAVRADIGVDSAVLGGAPGAEGVPAGAGHRGRHVVRVNIRLHIGSPFRGSRRVAAPRSTW